MAGVNIFLNYRRDDTAGHAGSLFDRLNVRFPTGLRTTRASGPMTS